MVAGPEAHIAFQPILSTRTSGVVAVESLVRPAGGETLAELYRAASKVGQLVRTDVALANQAILAGARHADLALHINILAVTATHAPDVLDFLEQGLRQTGRPTRDVVLEIGAPFFGLRRDDLLAGIRELRERGFQIALDGIGTGDMPLLLMAETAPDMLKIDGYLFAGLPDDPAAVAMVEALTHLAARIDARLAAVDVRTVSQLLALSRIGVRLAQGNLLAGAAGRPNIVNALAQAAELSKSDTGTMSRVEATPLVRDFLRPAIALPEAATADDVRTTFADRPEVNGIVLLDDQGRPRWSVDRSRFLLRVTGPYGHALHAKRAAMRHADQPRLIHHDATGMELLELVSDADWERTGDDVVVVDDAGRCVGIVRVTEVIRGVAELKIEQAATLNPLTRLPGSDTVAREVDRRIASGDMFVLSWLDVDGFKLVNDSVGFAAGDDLIRTLGHALSEAATAMSTVLIGHLGGDDFLLVTDLNEIAPLASHLVDGKWSAEGMSVSVSLASLVCAVGSVPSFREASRLLAPLKRQAKAVSGSSWVLGRPNSERVDVLRGRARTAFPTPAWSTREQPATPVNPPYLDTQPN